MMSIKNLSALCILLFVTLSEAQFAVNIDKSLSGSGSGGDGNPFDRTGNGVVQNQQGNNNSLSSNFNAQGQLQKEASPSSNRGQAGVSGGFSNEIDSNVNIGSDTGSNTGFLGSNNFLGSLLGVGDVIRGGGQGNVNLSGDSSVDVPFGPFGSGSLDVNGSLNASASKGHPQQGPDQFVDFPSPPPTTVAPPTTPRPTFPPMHREPPHQWQTPRPVHPKFRNPADC